MQITETTTSVLPLLTNQGSNILCTFSPNAFNSSFCSLVLFSCSFSTWILQQQTKLEENELDDAISVFRNHCEPHPLGMPPNMDGYVGPSPLVNSLGQTPQDNNPTNEPPTTIKLERVPANSKFDWSTSSCRYFIFLSRSNQVNTGFDFAEKRKDPLDTDTKPSSSSSVDGSNKGGKRTRR